MDQWSEYIGTNEKILSGKPHIKGTRLSIVFILGHLADGWSKQEILDNYPRLNQEALKAVYSYVHECMKDGLLFATSPKSA